MIKEAGGRDTRMICGRRPEGVKVLEELVWIWTGHRRPRLAPQRQGASCRGWEISRLAFRYRTDLTYLGVDYVPEGDPLVIR
jgi:hypothetical protein